VLGLGANGHIGFNEPAPALRARTHRAQLKPGTRRANLALFGGRIRAVPHDALSMGMATILEASSIVLVAMGRAKATAVQSLFTGRVSTTRPVSFLQLHPEVHVILDRAAAANLPQLLRGLNPGPPATVEVL
jgi:glucosamine-6-phosphate deaminase